MILYTNGKIYFSIYLWIFNVGGSTYARTMIFFFFILTIRFVSFHFVHARFNSVRIDFVLWCFFVDVVVTFAILISSFFLPLSLFRSCVRPFVRSFFLSLVTNHAQSMHTYTYTNIFFLLLNSCLYWCWHHCCGANVLLAAVIPSTGMDNMLFEYCRWCCINLMKLVCNESKRNEIALRCIAVCKPIQFNSTRLVSTPLHSTQHNTTQHNIIVFRMPTHSNTYAHTCIYSVDIRDRDFKAAKRWSDEMVFANRAYFLFEKQPGELAVQNAKESDSGIYRCRVDFKVAQTRNSKVNLTVIRKYIPRHTHTLR